MNRIWLLSLFFMLSFALKAQMVVTGTVTDSDDFTISDALVSVESTDITAVSDLDGNYSLTIPKEAAIDGKVTLKFSSVDHEDQTQTLDYQDGEIASNFRFNPTNKNLTDVVAVGYGKIKKELATSSVDVVDSKEFNNGNIANADQLIQGKVAGVLITSDGSPQGGSVTRIRGGSSLSASSAPLIIVDGLPLDTDQGVSFLNPQDIESVSVLKDAASTSIYGNRGANGVIIYTTKKGSSSGLKVNYNSQFTWNTSPYTYNQLSSNELVNLVKNTNWAAYPTMKDPTNNLGVYNIPGNTSSGKTIYNTNWMKEILKNSFSSNYNLSLSGNLLKRIPMRLTSGYTANNGMLITSGYQRWVVSTAINPSFFKNTLKVNANINATSERFRFADQGQISNAYTFDPTKPVRYAGLPFGNGYFEWANPTTLEAYGLAAANPYAALVQRNNTQISHRYFGNINVDYAFPFAPGLRAVVNGGLDLDIYHGINNTVRGARASYSRGTNNYLGNLQDYNGYGQNKSLDTYLVYNREFGKLNFEATGGYSWQKFYRRNFDTGNLLDPTNTGQKVNWPDDRNYATIGYFGRFNFNFSGKYLLYVNMRYDGTSKFGKDNRYEFFPGVSGGWIVSKENFMSGVKFFNELKARASYGKTGNQSVPAYQFIPLYNSGGPQSSYLFGNNGYLPIYPQYYNTNLKWEIMEDWNVGLDYAVWGRRISGSLDLYNKETKDLLAYVNIAPGANFANQGNTNKGSFTNKGVEFSINLKALQKPNSNLNIGYNIAYNVREIKDLGDGGDVPVGGIGGLIGQYITYNSVGHSPWSYYTYKQIYDGNGNPIEGAFANKDGDNAITDKDKYFYQNPFPKWTMGLRLDYNYKAFTFAMNWRANIGNYIYNNLRSNNVFLSNVPGTGDWVSNVSRNYYNSWFVQKDVKTMQSDYFIENGSFLKLDNMSLGYTISNLMGGSSSLTVSLSGNNLLIITKSTAKDPEVYNGIYDNLYPRARMYVLGLNFNF